MYSPGDITVEDLDADGCYIASRRVGNEKIPVVITPAPTESNKKLVAWAHELDDSQLEAAIQIYYDQWNFDTGSDTNRAIFDYLTTEKNRRMKSVRRRPQQHQSMETFNLADLKKQAQDRRNG